MGRYLVNNKVYDTEKSELICVYRKTIPHERTMVYHISGI